MTQQETSPAPAPAPAPVAAPAAAVVPEEAAVFVSNISPSATEKTVTDFFSFCGEIKSLVLRRTAAPAQDGTQEAIVTFESGAAAKTAQLLTNALIVDRAITVRVYDPAKDAAATRGKAEISQRSFGVPDSQRTKTSVIASMIASGYVLGEDARKAAMEYDEKHRITAQLKERAAALDAQLGLTEKVVQATTFVTDKLQQVDQQLGLSQAMHTVTGKVNETAVAARVEAERLAAVAAQNPLVNQCFTAFRTVGTAISTTYDQLRDESVAAIEAKHQERGEQQPLITPTTPPAPTDAAPAPATADAPMVAAAPATEPIYPRLDGQPAAVPAPAPAPASVTPTTAPTTAEEKK